MDYYAMLGVDKKASKDDIKKAFRKLAHKYHPDKQTGDESKFKEVNEAYSVLSDDKKRAEFDAYGRVFSGGAGSGAHQGFDFSDFASAFGGAKGGAQGAQFEFDMGDIFSEFFGGRGARQRRGSDISIDLQIDFKESILGVTRKVLITKTSQCDSCNGSGAKTGTSLEDCKGCGGKGSVHETKNSVLGTFTTSKACKDCGSRGKIPKEKCAACSGIGVLRKQQEISIGVPPGINDGEMIRMSGMGEAVPNGVSGDLYVKVHVRNDTQFKKEGVHITLDLPVKLTDALLGSTYTVPTLDGTLKVKIPPGVSYGEVLRVQGQGVVKGAGGERGDLLIKISITLPEKLSRKAKQTIEELKKEGI